MTPQELADTKLVEELTAEMRKAISGKPYKFAVAAVTQLAAEAIVDQTNDYDVIILRISMIDRCVRIMVAALLEDRASRYERQPHSILHDLEPEGNA